MLELTGLPMAQSLPLLQRCLQQTPSLQRLHLEGCGLQDRRYEEVMTYCKCWIFYFSKALNVGF